MKLGHIKSLFWELIGGEVVASPQVTSDLLLTWANMGVVDLCTAGKVLQDEAWITVTGGTQEYTLPSDCERAFRVAYDGKKLHVISQWDLQRADPKWDSFEGMPRRYYLNGLNGKIGLWPMPSQSTVFETGVVVSHGLHLYYDKRPVLLTGDDDQPALPSWCHHGVLFYMLKAAYSMIGMQRHSGGARYWSARYVETRNALASRTNKKSPARHIVPERHREDLSWFSVPRYPEYITDPEA